MSESESSYNEDIPGFYDEDEYEEESEEIVLEEELPHEEDEYTESDSYEYPYPTSSDDSWAELSSDEAIQKIIEKLPTYSSESSGDEPTPQSPPLQPASDSDAGSFVEHTDQKNDYVYEYDPHLYLKSIETYELYIVEHTDEADDADDEREHKKSMIKPSTTPMTPQKDEIYSQNIAINIQGQAQQDQAQPDTQTPQPSDNSNNNMIIKPSQSEIPIISADSATASIIPEDAEHDYKNENDIPPNTDQNLSAKPHRGKDAPRRVTKTRIVIKKVAAKRAPKMFKEGMKIRVKNNKSYDGVIGIIKYVGVINENKMVGIEILDENVQGDNDGIYSDNNQRYFACKPDRGLFLSVKNVKKYIDKEAREKSDQFNEFKKKSRQRRRYIRNNAQMYGNVVDNLWKERIDLVKQNKYRIVHKAGPREFGRIEYFGGDDEYTNALNDPTDWLAPRLRVPKKRKNEKPPAPKPGPRDIGRKDSFVGIEYKIGEEDEIRARKKALLESQKKKEWELARKKKLEEGKITRGGMPYKKKKKKSDQKKKTDAIKNGNSKKKSGKKGGKKNDSATINGKKSKKEKNKKKSDSDTKIEKKVDKKVNKKVNKKVDKKGLLKPKKKGLLKKSKSALPMSKNKSKKNKSSKKGIIRTKDDSVTIKSSKKKSKTKNGTKPKTPKTKI